MRKGEARRRRIDMSSAGSTVPSASSAATGTLQERPTAGIEVFNREAFVQRMMGDEEFAREIAGIFAHRLPEMLREVRESMMRGATEAFRGSVHKVKGSSANVGGEALSCAAQRIEQNEFADELPRLISDLELQAELLLGVLRSWTA